MREPHGDGPDVLEVREEHLPGDIGNQIGLGAQVVFDAEAFYLRVATQEVKVVVNLEDQLLDAVDEGFGGTAPGMLENLLRRAVLVDDAFVHEENARTYVAGKTHLVRDDEHGKPLLGQLAHDAEHLPHHGGIQGRCGLIEQDNLRMHGQRTGNGHTLFLAAGKRRRVNVGLLRQPYLVEQLQGFFFCLLLRNL